MKKTKFAALMVGVFLAVLAIVGGGIWWGMSVNSNASSPDAIDLAIKNMAVGSTQTVFGYEWKVVAQAPGIKTLWMTADGMNSFQKISRWENDNSNDNAYNAQTYIHEVLNSLDPTTVLGGSNVPLTNGATAPGDTGAGRLNETYGSIYPTTSPKSVLQLFYETDAVYASHLAPGQQVTNSTDDSNAAQNFQASVPLLSSDYIWVPSYREVMDGGTWGFTGNADRAFGNSNNGLDWTPALSNYTTNSTDVNNHTIGLAGLSSYAFATWLRSPNSDTSINAAVIRDGGSFNNGYVYLAHALRPAIHLKYTSLTVGATPASVELVYAPGEVELVTSTMSNVVISTYKNLKNTYETPTVAYYYSGETANDAAVNAGVTWTAVPKREVTVGATYYVYMNLNNDYIVKFAIKVVKTPIDVNPH